MGLSGTGRSREPGSGEVSDLGGDEGPELAGSMRTERVGGGGPAAGWEEGSGWLHLLHAKAAGILWWGWGG